MCCYLLALAEYVPTVVFSSQSNALGAAYANLLSVYCVSALRLPYFCTDDDAYLGSAFAADRFLGGGRF